MAFTILSYLTQQPASKSAIAKSLGKAKPTRYLTELVNKLRDHQHIEYTIPDKPNSRLQKYRLTEKGRLVLQKL